MAPNETPRRRPLLVALAARAPAIAPVRAPAATKKHNYMRPTKPNFTACATKRKSNAIIHTPMQSHPFSIKLF